MRAKLINEVFTHMPAKSKEELIQALERMSNSENKGDVNLPSLEQLPKGMAFNNGGDVYLPLLERLPEGTTFSCGGSVYLPSLEQLPEGTTFSNSGWVYLPLLKQLPKDTTFNIGGYVNLRSIEQLPKEFIYTGDKYVYLKHNNKIKGPIGVRTNEEFTYLKPKSTQEIDAAIQKLNKSELAKLALNKDIPQLYKRAMDRGYIPTNYDIEHSSWEEWRNMLKPYIKQLPINKIAFFAIKKYSPEMLQYAIDNGYELKKKDINSIVATTRYDKNSVWNEFIAKYINIDNRKKIVDRDPAENRKDYDAARKMINSTGKLKDVTSDKQEAHLTMQFIPNKKRDYQFSITKKGYVRKHWIGMYSLNSAPVMENSLMTYQEMADVLINYLTKNEYIK